MQFLCANSLSLVRVNFYTLPCDFIRLAHEAESHRRDGTDQHLADVLDRSCGVIHKIGRWMKNFLFLSF